jgi:hypothetical protein
MATFSNHCHRLLLPTFIAIGVLATAAPATPAGRIVIHGVNSGSHLQLTTKRGHIVVKGRMARHAAGCHHARRHVVVCPTRGVRAIELDMGSSGDLVEVRERLPIPLTAHLGPGSDKFIGHGERDFCFPEGSRCNRCIGRGGNDVCITGPRNSDCVGGRGRDYCRVSTGSDGCWGGPGNDVCRMGPGQDGCHGDAGDDRLFGGSNPDQLYGGRGRDFCDGGRGSGRSHGCERGPRH